VPVMAPADRRFRRAQVKPARQRKVLLARIARIARLVAALVALAIGTYYSAHTVAQTHTLHVRDIRVKGNQHLARGEVLAILEGLRGEHILATDLTAWRQRLLGSPWIEYAALRRLLPSTIEVVIRERRPLALARLGTSLFLIDDEGLVIDEYGPNYAQLDLPIVDGLTSGPPTNGPTIDPARAYLAARTVAALAPRPDLLQRVSQLDVSNPHDAVILLDQDPVFVHVGEDEFRERLQAYLDLSEALRARVPEIEYADLRFADRVYVRPARRSLGEGGPARGARQVVAPATQPAHQD
jgi:cell division septal protein FtsQ